MRKLKVYKGQLAKELQFILMNLLLFKWRWQTRRSAFRFSQRTISSLGYQKCCWHKAFSWQHLGGFLPFQSCTLPRRPSPVTDGDGIKTSGPFPPRWANSAWLHELQRLLSSLHGTMTTTDPATLPFPSTDIDSKNTS